MKRAKPHHRLPVDIIITASGGMVFTLPLRLVSEANAHEHWRARQKRAKEQRSTTTILMRSLAAVPVSLPDVVTITRIAPRSLDSDNAVGSAKHVRDGVADYLGIDDRRPDIEWLVKQDRASTPNTYGVMVELRWCDSVAVMP